MPDPSKFPCVVAAIVVVATVACSTGTDEPVATPTSDTVATAAAVELPEATSPYVVIGDEPEIAVTSRCASSTPSRSTVLATADDGTEIAVTVFTAADPVVEVDVVTAGGRTLVSRRLPSTQWRFDGARLVGVGDLRSGDEDVPVTFVVDFSDALDECDNQDQLGPGEVGSETSATPTPAG